MGESRLGLGGAELGWAGWGRMGLDVIGMELGLGWVGLGLGGDGWGSVGLG